MRLKDKVCIVTGGASGFGAEFVRRFCAEGAHVVSTDVNDALGEQVASEAGDASYTHCDVANAQDVARVIAATHEKHGRIDAIMSNAGIVNSAAPLEDMDDDFYDKMMAVNVKGVYLFLKHAIPAMRAQGGGVIVNTASVAALRPRIGVVLYAASKGAVITMTKAAATELARDNIRVNALAPVMARTPMVEAQVGADNEDAFTAGAGTVPLGRLCDVTDMASCAVFLASDEAAFLTGVVIPVDGGRAAA